MVCADRPVGQTRMCCWINPPARRTHRRAHRRRPAAPARGRHATERVARHHPRTHELRARSLQLEDLGVSVLLGQVRLRGRAATAQDRHAAEVVAGAVPGVESVVDELEVQDVPADHALKGN